VPIRGRGQGARKIQWPVKPLETVAAPTEADIAASTDTNQLRTWWTGHPHLQDTIKARVDQLKAPE